MWPIYLFVGLFFCLSEIQCSEGRAEYLLPGDVKPYHYDVKAVYDIDPSTNFSYFGVVDILITANAPTSKIVLHSQGFTVNTEKTSLKSESGAITIQDVKLEDKYNLLVLTLGSNLVKNENYTLTIPFSGNLKKDLDGVYISTYVNKMTSPPISEYLVTTQFEAISARKGFPCFDEPMYKATFTVTLGHHRDYSAVSNMPQALSGQESPFEDIWSWNEVGARFNKDKSKFLWDRFEKSVPMSTYLVAFVISKFGYVESPSDLSTSKFKIWARRDALQQTTYASIVGPKVLTIFEKWFNVPFPLPKQDMMAIPDFSAGAMENWGLITYRETALLYDKKQSSLTAKERVAEVIAHELAHQWFGNLVTMKWWSDLWLNEGFATFVGSLGVRGVEPSWQSAENNAVSNARSVLALDALETSHPVSAPIDDPKRIYEIFDEISYKKGANLIRMMTMFLGEDVFRKAITNYLLKYSYKNAEQDDLWQELTEVTQTYNVLSRNVTVKEIMDTWTKQTGYPLLTVKRDYTDNTLTIMQKRYLSLGAKSKTSVSWWVPLNVLCEHEVGKKLPEPIQWLSNKEGTDHEFKFDHDAQNNQWILFNADMIGLYRVNYDQRNWDLLIKTLNSDKYQNIPTLNRVQLLEDAFALSWSGVIDYSTTLKVPYPKSAQRDSITKAPLSVCLKAVSFEPYVLSPEKVTSHLKVDISLLVNYLSQETELLPIETALSALSKIENVLLRAPEYGAFQKFVRKLITNAYQSSGGLYKRAIVNSDDLRSVTLQVLLSRWACRMNVHGCEQNAISLFQEWMEVDNPDEENPIPLDLRSTVYCVAISRGSVEEWKFLFQRYQNSNVASAKISAMLALSCTREVWILKQFLEWTIDSGTEVRTQDAGSVITSIARTSVGYYLVKDFLYNRIEEIHKAFFGQSRRLGHVVKAVAEQFTSQKDLDEFLAWRDRNQKYLEETKLAISQAVEKAQVNIGWLSRNQNVVVNKMREFTS